MQAAASPVRAITSAAICSIVFHLVLYVLHFGLRLPHRCASARAYSFSILHVVLLQYIIFTHHLYIIKSDFITLRYTYPLSLLTVNHTPQNYVEVTKRTFTD